MAESVKPVIKSESISPRRVAGSRRRAGKLHSLFSKHGHSFVGKSAQFLIGTLVRTLAQGGLFVVLAREMPISEYGIFVGVTALIAIISPFSSLGALSLVVQNYADAPSKWASHLTRALVLCSIAGIAATLLVVMAGLAIWGDRVGWQVLLGLALADLVAWRLIEVVGTSVHVRGRIPAAVSIPAGLHVVRLAAAVAMVSGGPMDLGLWAATSAVLSAAVAALAVWYGMRGSGPLRLRVRESFSQLRAGLLFAVGLSAQTVYNDIDKVMLSRLSTSESAAIYAAAYRVVDFAHVPLRSMAAVSYPKFFELGKDGPKAAFGLTRTLIPKYLLYSVPASLLLIAFAWVTPYVFGPDYGDAEFALQGLSLLLVLKSLHYLAADTLSGSRLQGKRTIAQVAIAIFNALMNLWLIPEFGWKGAVVSSLVSDALLAMVLWGALVAALRRQPQTQATLANQQQVAEGVL